MKNNDTSGNWWKWKRKIGIRRKLVDGTKWGAKGSAAPYLCGDDDAVWRRGKDARKKKIERHHRLRAGKGFRTIEKYTDMYKVQVPENKGILLECISNLTANELYREDKVTGPEETVKRVVQGVRSLAGQTERLVIVTNEVNSDINGYSEETEEYRACIGCINQELAKMADCVTEVVYGIPVQLKGSRI